VVKGAGVMLKDCFRIMLSAVILLFMHFLTRHTVEKIYGATELGYYSAFAMVIVVFSIMAGAVHQVLFPAISAKYMRRLKGDIIRIILIMLGIISLAALIILLLARLLGNLVYSFLFGIEILGHMYLLLPVIITSIMLTVMSFFSTCLIAMQKRVPMLIGMFAGAVLMSIMIIPATQSSGMLGTIHIYTISLCVTIAIQGFNIFKSLNDISLKAPSFPIPPL
jgi:O-antigen/teichoic acid export membrane protein